MRRLFYALCRRVNEFGKLFDRDAAPVQVSCAEGYKVPENDSVSFYDSIRYIMRV